MSSIMKSELERLAAVAVGHGRDDPALDVFLVFVGALDPLPDAAALEPAARRIGKLRLAQALDRPGEPRLGACRLLAAASGSPRRTEPPRIEDDQPSSAVGGATMVGRPGGRLAGTVTVERPVETARSLPELVEGLLQAIRGALSLLA